MAAPEKDGSRNLKSQISNLESEISNLNFEISNLKSHLSNPKQKNPAISIAGSGEPFLAVDPAIRREDFPSR
jgi:hypothetical protein